MVLVPDLITLFVFFNTSLPTYLTPWINSLTSSTFSNDPSPSPQIFRYLPRFTKSGDLPVLKCYLSAWIWNRITLLLSLLPPSCIVAPKRELANILNHSTSISQTNQFFSSKQQSIDIEVNLSREHSPSSSPSFNSSREMSINSATSSMDYAECI